MKNDKNKILFIGKDYEQILDKIINKEEYELIETSPNNLDENLKVEALICNENILQLYDIKNRVKTDKIIVYEQLINDLNYRYKSEFYRNYDYNYLKNRLNKFSNTSNLGIITAGSSYSLFGIDEDDLRYNNLSLASQDIYYSYKLCKNIIEYNKDSNVKYCVLSLAYYSFNFDLSKTKNASQIIDDVYIPILNDFHNYRTLKLEAYKDRWSELEFQTENIYGNLLKHKKVNEYFMDKLSKNYFKDIVSRESAVGGTINLFSISENERYNRGSLRTSSHNKLLNHKETINENLNILNEFFTFLNKKDIIPVIVVFPASKYYREYISLDFKDIFYKSLSILDKDLKFEILDLFDDDRFTVEDYVDTDHLSKTGSIKATKIINEFLNKL